MAAGTEESVSSSQWQHPPSFYCPISQQCMHDPVVLADGQSYERRHIEQWLAEHDTSPATGAPLTQKTTFANHALRNAIEEYFQQIFGVHRRAIRKSIARTTKQGAPHPDTGATAGPATEEHHGLDSNHALLRTIDALMQCSLLVGADLDTERVLQQIMREAKLLVGAEAASVFLIDTSRSELWSTVNSTGGELRLPITAGIAGHVATTGEAVVVLDAYSDKRFNRSVDNETGFKTRDILCVPLKTKSDGVIGVVQLVNKTGEGVLQLPNSRDGHDSDKVGHTFAADDLHFLKVFASQATMAIINSGLPRGPQARSTTKKSRTPWGLFARCLPRTTTKAKPAAAKCPKVASHIPQYASEDEGTSLANDAPLDFQPVRSEIPFGPASSGLQSVMSQFSSEGKEVDGSQGLSFGDVCLDIDRVAPSTSLADFLTLAYDSWQIDTLALAHLTGNKPLSTLGGYLFDRLGLVDSLQLDGEKLERFLRQIELGYNEATPYHNRAHAASVMHAMYALVERGGLAKLAAAAFSSSDGASEECAAEDGHLEKMACLLAAAVHDYDHLGVSNDFLVRTHHVRAVRYNDRHVNEHHHVASAFALLRRPEFNFLEHIPSAQFRRLRSLVIDLVLGTDMADNSNILESFIELADGDTPPTSFVPTTAKGAVLLLQMAMKCADLGHLASDWECHVQWVKRIEQEFFEQGDREKECGLSPISFLMDRNKPGASETQVGFFEFVANPLFRALARAVPAVDPVMSAVTANCSQWRSLEAEAKLSSTEKS